jgi:hypothetical protein
MSDIEKQRREFQRNLELFHAYEALKSNPNFRKLITEGFCIAEVIRLNRMASHQMTNEAKQAVAQQAQAAPILESFLTRVNNEGEYARSMIPQLDALIAQKSEEDEVEA